MAVDAQQSVAVELPARVPAACATYPANVDWTVADTRFRNVHAIGVDTTKDFD